MTTSGSARFAVLIDADCAMIIDAMDLPHTGRFSGFCLVSSDSDFTRLAARIREDGLTVHGFGENKTPKAFVAACDTFTHIETLRQVGHCDTVVVPLKPTPRSSAPANAQKTQPVVPQKPPKVPAKQTPKTPAKSAKKAVRQSTGQAMAGLQFDGLRVPKVQRSDRGDRLVRPRDPTAGPRTARRYVPAETAPSGIADSDRSGPAHHQ